MGRKSKFDPKQTQKITALYATGKTDIEVANALGVTEQTINNWKKSQPEFFESLKAGKEVADEKVENALYQSALGYSHDDEQIFCAFGKVTKVKTRKHYPPNVTAAIFWLKNRRPDKWRDKDQDPQPPPPQNRSSKPEMLTFEQYCINAGYPSPYPKQIEMKDFGITTDDPRLLLGARGYGKTDYVTVLGVGYAVYCDYFGHKNEGTPIAETNLIISKSKSRNTAMIQEIAMSLKKNGVELEKENASCIRVQGLIGKDHSVEVLTIKSSFRGRHPKRIIMDDPVTEEDTSDAMRILVKKKYDEAYKLCENIVIIGQPAHAFDLYAELRPQIKKLEIPWGSIPELDADLEAMKSAGIDQNSIEMSYHLRVPVDGTMPFSKIKYTDTFPIGESIAFLDPSEGGDYTAISIVKMVGEGVIVQGHAWKRAWYHCLDELVPILKARRVTRLCFETNKFGLQPVSSLSQALSPLGIGVVGRHSDSDKHAAIMSAGSYAHMIHLSKESDKVYTDQVVKYEYGSKFDDAPDSLARCLEWIGLLRGKK